MAKSNDPLASLEQGKQMTIPSVEQLNDLHEHMVRLQKQVNELQAVLATPTTLLEGTSLVNSFEDKVWESVMVAAISTALHPSRIINDTPKAMEQMIGRALRIADNAIAAARAYKESQRMAKEAQDKAKINDTLRELIDTP